MRFKILAVFSPRPRSPRRLRTTPAWTSPSAPPQATPASTSKLQQASHNTQRFSSDNGAPYNANSPSNVTGQFNEDATRNRLGSNFGKSVTPERPAQNFAPAFTAPARPH